MKGHSDSVEIHSDIPKNQFYERRLQNEISERRNNLRNGTEKLRVYVFSVEVLSSSAGQVAESVRELKDLLNVLGDECVGETRQRLSRINPTTCVGAGKALEIARDARAGHADYVVSDRDLSHSQARNLETIIGLPVLDRASVILQIFAKNAKTREARVQVAIAHLEYLLPRLSSSWISSERQGGGSASGGAARSRGSGESKLELSQRHVRQRLEGLRRELKQIEKNRAVQGKLRRDAFSVALVGYTNAGKTTLMNALTKSSLPVRDGVFETLDTSVRRMHGCGEACKILISDTVGFIRNLPHGLVASFRSTLSDVGNADLLLHVVDGSDPDVLSHVNVTEKVLNELGAEKIPRLIVVNKADRGVKDASALTQYEHMFVSALCREDVDQLRNRILQMRP